MGSSLIPFQTAMAYAEALHDSLIKAQNSAPDETEQNIIHFRILDHLYDTFHIEPSDAFSSLSAHPSLLNTLNEAIANLRS